MFKARLARFYHWSDDAISNLDYSTALEYYECMDMIKSEERLHELEIADYPHLKGNDRSNIFKKYKSKVYNPKVYTSEGLEDLLKAKGFM